MSGRQTAIQLGRELLGWRILDKVNALLDIPFQSFNRRFNELLLVVIGLAEDIYCFFGAIGLQRISKS